MLTSDRPGMGLNAYFTFQVVGFHGTGTVSYGLALTAVFIEGFIFVFLSLIGMRQWLVKIIPNSIKVASGVGIGLFLTETGLSYSGIGLITGGFKTPTDLGGCSRAQYLMDGNHCSSHRMTNPTVLVFYLFRNISDELVVMDRHSFWRGSDSLPYGLSSKVSYHHRNTDRFHYFLAVGTTFSMWCTC
jgi:hypothetical protein